ncbi:MAG: efflux transporter periplasmic adaptor subunit [Bacteroidetes bacterium B1(2017)]|nr:MAG: efflux transporter periplasmic adaptor subunit [Bacteroidetes bacterium B1(2017)]
MLLAKKFLTKASLFIAALGLLYSCGNSQKEQTSEKPFEVTDTMMARLVFSTAQIKPVQSVLTMVGKVIADENKLVEIFPLVGGNVMKVNVELGDFVNKGQVLAVIRSGEVADFEKQMIDAKNDLHVAQNNQRVAEELFISKLISEKDVVIAKNEVTKVKADIDRLKQIFAIYGIENSAEYRVIAPISGFIIDKKINPDMLLRSDKSDNIFTIAQINDVWVNANVYETDIAKVSEGMTASIKTLSYPDTIFRGHVDKVYNILDPQTKTMKIRIKLPNLQYLLKPEMNASIYLNYIEHEKKVEIPSSAIIFDKGKSYVMVFKSRTEIETREVKVYQQSDEVTFLTKGLEEGEKVISKNGLLIYDALND